MACPKCRGWGISPDKMFFSPEKCTQCLGGRIVDEDTGRPFGYIETEIEKAEREESEKKK